MVWLVRVRRAAWFLRVLQEMLVLRDIPEVPGSLMGDSRAVAPDPEPGIVHSCTFLSPSAPQSTAQRLADSGMRHR